MLNKCKTCSTLSEEVGFAALRLCLVIPLWSKCTVLQQNMSILLQGRAVVFYRAVTPSHGVEGQGVKTTDFIAWDHNCRNFSKFDCEILFSDQIALFGFCSILVFLVVYIDFSCEVWKSLSCVHSLQPHGLYSLWNSPGQNTGMGAIPFSRGSSQHRDQTQVSCSAGRILYKLSHQRSLFLQGTFLTGFY